MKIPLPFITGLILLTGTLQSQTSLILLDSTRTSFAAVTVPDIDSASAWYRRVFGFQPAFTYRSEKGDVRVAILASGQQRIELQQHSAAVSGNAPKDKAFLQFGIFKFGVFVTGLDSAFSALERNGIVVVVRPFSDDDGRLRSAILRDPFGNSIQMFEFQKAGK